MQDEWSWVWIVIVAAFIGYSLRNKTEGVYESNYITCEKPAGSEKWRNKWKESNRWDAIGELDYQVSFAQQRVVMELPSALPNCTVFDRQNWNCGGIVSVHDGDMNPQCSNILGPECRLPLNWLSHPLVYVMGADQMCKNQSSVLEIWYQGEMKRN